MCQTLVCQIPKQCPDRKAPQSLQRADRLALFAPRILDTHTHTPRQRTGQMWVIGGDQIHVQIQFGHFLSECGKAFGRSQVRHYHHCCVVVVVFVLFVV